MGMLITHHEGYWPEDSEQAEQAPEPRKRTRKPKAEQAPEPVDADQLTESGSDSE